MAKGKQPGTKQLTVISPEDLAEWVEAEAKYERRSVSSHIVILLERQKAVQEAAEKYAKIPPV